MPGLKRERKNRNHLRVVKVNAICVLKCQKSAGGPGSVHLGRPKIRSAEIP